MQIPEVGETLAPFNIRLTYWNLSDERPSVQHIYTSYYGSFLVQ